MSQDRRLRIGVAGLGRAFSVMLPTFMRDPRVALVAAADPRAEARQRFAADFSARTFQTVDVRREVGGQAFSALAREPEAAAGAARTCYRLAERFQRF